MSVLIFILFVLILVCMNKSNNVTEYFNNPDKKCPHWLTTPANTRKYTGNCSYTTGCEKHYSINSRGNAMPCFEWAGGCALLGGESGKTYPNYTRNECK